MNLIGRILSNPAACSKNTAQKTTFDQILLMKYMDNELVNVMIIIIGENEYTVDLVSEMTL